MNTARAKLLAWGAAGLLGTALSAYVAYFVIAVKPTLAQGPSEQRVTQELDKVPEEVERAENIVPFASVKEALIDLNWTAKEKPKAAEVTSVPVAPDQNREAVANLVKVIWIQCDAEAPAESRAILKYLDAAKVTSPAIQKKDLFVLKKAGERLDPPLAHVTLAEVRPSALVFTFDDAARDPEELSPSALSFGEGLIQVDDPSQAKVYEHDLTVSRSSASGEAPRRTELVRANTWQIGIEDAELIEKNYSLILSEDLRYERHRDPRTGKYDGVELKEVKEGSIPAAHGAKSGDVIKSINGHPVTSPQEAISFVKNNKDKYDVWVVVVENKGLTKTYTYKSPPKN